MNLREMIELGAKTTGRNDKLAELLGVSPTALSEAKNGRRGLPLAACGKLAAIIGISEWAVVCASALVTEKDEETKNYLRPFVETGRKAAAWLVGVCIAMTMTIVSTDSHANDTLFMSSEDQGRVDSGSQAGEGYKLRIMRSAGKWIRRKAALVKNILEAGIPRFYCQGWSGA